MNAIKKTLLLAISEVHTGNREEGEAIVEAFYNCFRHIVNLTENALKEREELLEEVLEFFNTCKEVEEPRDFYQVFDENLLYDLNKKINKVLLKDTK
jgi:hypothetical protein